MKNDDADKMPDDEPMFDKHISGNQLTLIPRGKIFYSKKEVREIEEQRDFWKDLFDSLLSEIASMPGGEGTQRQVNGLIGRFAALAKAADNSGN
jgi:hypothetical protein